MDDTAHVQEPMVEAAGAGAALGEAQRHKLLVQESLPMLWGLAGALEAAHEPGAPAGLVDFRRQLHEHSAVGERVEMRLARVKHLHLDVLLARRRHRQQEPQGLKRRRCCEEVVRLVCCDLFDDEPAANQGLLGVALVHIDPLAADGRLAGLPPAIGHASALPDAPVKHELDFFGARLPHKFWW